MPRKPNYRFERSQREKTKALKKADRLKARAEKTAARKAKAGEGEALDEAQVETLDETQDGGISGSG